MRENKTCMGHTVWAIWVIPIPLRGYPWPWPMADTKRKNSVRCGQCPLCCAWPRMWRVKRKKLPEPIDMTTLQESNIGNPRKTKVFSGKIIYKWWIFPWHVWLLQGSGYWLICLFQSRSLQSNNLGLVMGPPVAYRSPTRWIIAGSNLRRAGSTNSMMAAFCTGWWFQPQRESQPIRNGHRWIHQSMAFFYGITTEPSPIVVVYEIAYKHVWTLQVGRFAIPSACVVHIWGLSIVPLWLTSSWLRLR